MIAALLLAEASPAAATAFKSELLAADSATAVLQAHCPSATIRAVRSRKAEHTAPDEARAALALRARDSIRHRRVKLKCGKVTYSVADNWYVPQRLTPAMNAALDGGDTPYGRVIAPLRATRRTLGVSERKHGAFLTVRAVLTAGTGEPLAVVVERYQSRMLRR